MLVVDASVVAGAVGFSGKVAAAGRVLIAENDIAAPDLMRIETQSVFRRRLQGGHLTSDQADAALASLAELSVEVFPASLLLERAWELRSNFTTYDACYVALAEALRCPLATADQRLARAPGSRCDFVVVGPIL